MITKKLGKFHGWKYEHTKVVDDLGETSYFIAVKEVKPKTNLTAEDILRLVELDEEFEKKKRQAIEQFHRDEFFAGVL